MITCPRCLGKGEVDMGDIKRLKKELFWGPGKCAYCNGFGKVPPDRVEKVDVDFEYLTTELTSTERHKILNRDEDALKRGEAHKKHIEGLANSIVEMYFLKNLEPTEIAVLFLKRYGHLGYSDDDKQEIVDYIERVINSKREK